MTKRTLLHLILVLLVSIPIGVNSDGIRSLADAKNFLYLINAGAFPDKGSFLNAIRATDYDLVIIDLFDDDGNTLLPADISSLKTKRNGGKRLVIAYMSIGEAEDYRYYWDRSWKANPPAWLEGENANWEGNYEVRYWDPDWQRIIFRADDSYLNRIIDAGFDGVPGHHRCVRALRDRRIAPASASQLSGRLSTEGTVDQVLLCSAARGPLAPSILARCSWLRRGRLFPSRVSSHGARVRYRTSRPFRTLPPSPHGVRNG